MWGTRGKWCLLSGLVGAEPVAVAIFDRPGNPGYPTYWHARGYGLFAANPLGQKALSDGKDTLNFAIEPKQSARFRYRVRIATGADRRRTGRGGVEGVGEMRRRSVGTRVPTLRRLMREARDRARWRACAVSRKP